MKHFNITTPDKQIVRVEIYPTKKSFNSALVNKYDFKKLSEAFCEYFVDGNVRNKKRKKIGTMVFCAKNLNSEVIAHECTHVFTTIAIQENWDFYKNNEEFAEYIGKLTGLCTAKMIELGYTVQPREN